VKNPGPHRRQPVPGRELPVPSLWELGEPVYEQNVVVRECSEMSPDHGNGCSPQDSTMAHSST
jgi:hypothetical protein